MSTGNTGGMLPSTGWCSLGEQLYPLLLLFEYINSFFNRSLAICVFSRTWCEQAAPYWIPTPRTTGTKSKGQRAGPHICSETLRTTRARWHRMSGKPTWSPSPSSLKTWVSLQTIIELCFSCGKKMITQSLLCLLLFISVLTVDYLDVSNPEKATFPRFREIQEAYPKELGSSVRFPQFNIGTQGNKGGNDASIRPQLNFFLLLKLHLLSFWHQQSPLLPLQLRQKLSSRRSTQFQIGNAAISSHLPLCLLLWW